MAKSTKTVICPLCHDQTHWFCDYFKTPKTFYRCPNCKAIFKPSNFFLDPELEKNRYRSHNNDVKDTRYQDFVSPITDAINKNFSKNASGLDYGCGTGPVASHVLEQQGFSVRLYDPYFYPDTSYEDNTYDFIICCEVMEHFYMPDKEFSKLKTLLNHNGKLYCKTKMISDDFTVEAFKNWHYKNDPTHVFFYSPKTLQVICQKFGYKSVYFDDKLITFSA
ncbi:MAG: methyltransferase domain-containing protein [Bacteroidetes bacterium]|jgi:SAM-dependent methyltransferase|nr:methyltransferase domain-containing protein [Bacteroidota bacterium]